MATDEPPPRVVVIAGPNGAGKSTLARLLLPEAMPFLNADEIAKALPLDFPGNREMESGRLLLRRLSDLAFQRRDFALETTLSSRSLAPKITGLRELGYRFHLLYLMAPSPELAMARVASRVRRGGHDIPEATIRRRFTLGARNFFALFQPLADTWAVFRNWDDAGPVPVARGGDAETVITDEAAWKVFSDLRNVVQ